MKNYKKFDILRSFFSYYKAKIFNKIEKSQWFLKRNIHLRTWFFKLEGDTHDLNAFKRVWEKNNFSFSREPNVRKKKSPKSRLWTRSQRASEIIRVGNECQNLRNQGQISKKWYQFDCLKIGCKSTRGLEKPILGFMTRYMPKCPKSPKV